MSTTAAQHEYFPYRAPPFHFEPWCLPSAYHYAPPCCKVTCPENICQIFAKPGLPCPSPACPGPMPTPMPNPTPMPPPVPTPLPFGPGNIANGARFNAQKNVARAGAFSPRVVSPITSRAINNRGAK